MWAANIPSSGPKSISVYRLAIVQEVLLEAKFSFQVLNDSILCALNLLIRSYSSSSIGLLWKSPAGQKHKAVESLVRHINPSQTFKSNKDSTMCQCQCPLFSNAMSTPVNYGKNHGSRFRCLGNTNWNQFSEKVDIL